MGLGNTKRLRGHEGSIAQRFPEKSPPEGPRAGELLRCRDTLLRGRIHPPSHGYSSFDAQKHHVGLLRGRTYDVHREAVSCEAQERHRGIHQNRGAMRSCSCHGRSITQSVLPQSCLWSDNHFVTPACGPASGEEIGYPKAAYRARSLETTNKSKICVRKKHSHHCS